MPQVPHSKWINASRALDDVRLYVLETRNDEPALYQMRRRLPHYVPDGLIVMMNFYQADALPRKLIDDMHENYRRSADSDDHDGTAFIEFFDELESKYDTSTGLFVGETAETVNNAILHMAQEGWLIVYAYVVMPTHVHAVVRSGTKSVAPACADFKHFTTTAVNKRSNLSAHGLWEREYFDRWIRSNAHFMHAMRYVHNNPVKAGLCPSPTDWNHSSAKWYA